VEEIEGAEWQDLGMPETLWINRVREFGPLIISIDTQGNNLISQNKVGFNEKKKPVLERISKQLSFIK
jgi:L(+)-tartrate dehydratase beta subunit